MDRFPEAGTGPSKHSRWATGSVLAQCWGEAAIPATSSDPGGGGACSRVGGNKGLSLSLSLSNSLSQTLSLALTHSTTGYF